MSIRRIILSLLWTVLAIPGLHAMSSTQTSKTEGCASSTVDDTFAPERAARAKVFLAELQAAVKAGERDRVAEMVAYPARVIASGGKRAIRSRSAFLAQYERVLTGPVRGAILKQSPDCLFGNWQGVMIGDGVVWFEEQADGKDRVITFNEDASPR